MFYDAILIYVHFRDTCNYRGVSAMLLFSVYSGIDSHALLLPLAHEYNMSVYFGLPFPPSNFVNASWEGSYLEFLRRVMHSDQLKTAQGTANQTNPVIQGYFLTDYIFMYDVFNSRAYTGLLSFLRNISQIVHGSGKRFGVATSANTFVKTPWVPPYEYTIALQNLANVGQVDTVVVRDGRGSGFSPLIWSTQKGALIKETDESLFNIIRTNTDPHLDDNSTFDQAFSASTNEVSKV